MKQVQALRVLLSGDPVFLTGPPGSGKTYVLNKFISELKRRKRRVAITASTGIAATHIGGSTVHSWSGLGIREQVTEKDKKWLMDNTRLVKRYNNTDTLIVDEASMVHGARLDMINKVAKWLRGSEAPFGGMQIVLSGDLFQLPPINRNGNKIDFIHQSESWRELRPKICYLKEQHRQGGDDLYGLLEAMRRGEVMDSHYDALSNRLKEGVNNIRSVTKLYSHNQDVEHINNKYLEDLEGQSKFYNMSTNGTQSRIDQMKRGVLAPEILELKVGAEVMFVANNFAEGFVNGSRGKVIGFSNENKPMIEMHNSGRIVTVSAHSWTMEEDNKERATVRQIPLRLAWAITIHKSQGMSLDSAEIDLSRAFTPGMGYVALSRVRTLDGVFLKGINNSALLMHPDIYEFDKKILIESEILASTISDEDFSSSGHLEGNGSDEQEDEAGVPDEALLLVLRNWRSHEAKMRSIPLYMVASNKTLESLSINKPTTIPKIKIISGIGPKTVERYGEEIVDLIREHIGEKPLGTEEDYKIIEFLDKRSIKLNTDDIRELKKIIKKCV